MIGRRQFITLLGGAAAAWPLAAQAQPSNQIRRIGVLMTTPANDPTSQAYLAAFAQGLQELGWIVGRNTRIDYRWGEGNVEKFRSYAANSFPSRPMSSWRPQVRSSVHFSK